MPIPSITFITQPKFAVDMRRYAEESSSAGFLPYRVGKIALSVIKGSVTVVTTFGSVLISTVGSSGTSFMHVVLGYRGSLYYFHPPEDPYVGVVRVVVWAVGIFQCVVAKTCERLLETSKHLGHLSLLKPYCGELNPAHIRTKQLRIDVSAVPAQVRVDDLMTIFDEINFTNRNAPGYFAPASRKEESRTYSKDELHTYLVQFVRRVKEREAFLMTPPAYDIVALRAFYQKIEDAVRFSIHQVDQELASFKQQHQNPDGSFNPNTLNSTNMRKYNEILEKRGRVALDLAIAGDHCGGRYMGDSLGVYFRVQEVRLEESFENSLIELLATSRQEIAERQSSTRAAQSTHESAQYMQRMGKLLGIPGSADVVDYFLRGKFDRAKHLKNFFGEYTVDFIIDVVQEQMKKSQAFREQCLDWIRDQVGNWKSEDYTKIARSKIPQVESILEQPTTEHKGSSFSATQNSFLLLHNCISALGKNDAASLKDGEGKPLYLSNWSTFLDELLALDAAKKWGDQQCKTRKERMKIFQQIKADCTDAILGEDLLREFREFITSNKPIQEDLLHSKWRDNEKIRRIRSVVSWDKETIARIMNKHTHLATAVKDYYALERRREFLLAMPVSKIQEEGLPPHVLEWILVAFKVFAVPQILEEGA